MRQKEIERVRGMMREGGRRKETHTSLAWVSPGVCGEVTGPCFVHQRQENGSAIVLSFNAPLTQVETSTVEPPALPAISGNDEEDNAFADGATIVASEVTPLTVHQVWVATNLPESQTWTFKSAQGTFLGSSSYGAVIASNEARGPQEEWVLRRVDPMASSSTASPGDGNDTVIPGPRAGFAIQSKYGGWLATEDASSSADSRQRRRLVRADAKELTPACVWDVSVQWRFRHAYRKTQRATKVGSSSAASLVDEVQLARSRQGWNAGSWHQYAPESRRELLRAQREGRLAEAMLDRRSKLKSDKYTKVCPPHYTF